MTLWLLQIPMRIPMRMLYCEEADMAAADESLASTRYYPAADDFLASTRYYASGSQPLESDSSTALKDATMGKAVIDVDADADAHISEAATAEPSEMDVDDTYSDCSIQAYFAGLDGAAPADDVSDLLLTCFHDGYDADNESAFDSLAVHDGSTDAGDISRLQDVEDTEDDAADGSSMTREMIEYKHRQIMHSSYTNKAAYMRFCRQASSTKRPIQAELATRFSTDKQSLFLDYIESGENWLVCQAIEARRQVLHKKGKTVYRLKTKRDLMVQYGDDEGLVNEIIASKRKQGLASTNPECPHRADQDLFYCLDEVSMAENHVLEHSQEMRGETEIDKELTKQLFNGSAFGDKAVPLRSGHPLAVWDQVSSGLQSGESHEIELIPAAGAMETLV